MRFKRSISSLTVLAILALIFSSCNREQKSASTGMVYNDPAYGGMEQATYVEQQTGPGLVFIEGGTFIMGGTGENVMYEWDNMPRRVTVNSFYMDQTEVRNIDYVEYLYWLSRVFRTDYPEVFNKALPDTLVWRAPLAYNEPLVELYLRHPAYQNYPVVGVTWEQATEYCLWRSDRVNEYLLIEEGILSPDPDQRNENHYNTDTYLAGQYEGIVNKGKVDLDPNGQGIRQVRMEDGILLPKYRLPTEAEWEYAAQGLIGNTYDERVVERKIYPWNGNFTRTSEKGYQGSMMANFKRGRGDYMGIAGSLNDGAMVPEEVGSYWPNDYGLYNMAGNVAEWVQDVYRPLSFETVSDMQPFRGNVFTTLARDDDGMLLPKDELGRLQTREVTTEESANRRNYRKANNINYRDGDFQSNIIDGGDWKAIPDSSTTAIMYDYGVNSLISDKARVVKGGSWRDRAYFLSPGVRRYLQQDMATDYVGFRCAMSRMGSTVNP
jgi:gliding motility-associated lipoprotein GldJ